jgi:hypothetical protein
MNEEIVAKQENEIVVPSQDQLYVWNLVVSLEAVRAKHKAPISWIRQQLKIMRKKNSNNKDIKRWLNQAIKMSDKTLDSWVAAVVVQSMSYLSSIQEAVAQEDV